MIASESVLLPDPFGPMIACTEPLSTTRSIPLRIVLPSTLTTRSLISRLDIHTLPRRGFRELREGHAIESFRDAVLQPEPDGPRSAVGLAHAVHDGLSFGGTDLGLDRSLERAHDVARGDLARLARQDVAAARAALAVHETGLAKGGDELLEVGLGQVLTLGDGVQRDASLAPVLCEVDHETHPVLAASGDVEGGRGISEHFTRNCTRQIPAGKGAVLARSRGPDNNHRVPLAFRRAVVGSTNPAKVEAVRRTLGRFAPDCVVMSVAVPSGVGDMPLGEE